MKSPIWGSSVPSDIEAEESMAVESRNTASVSKKPWHRPEARVISIRTTAVKPGSNSDSGTPTDIFTP